MEFVYSILFFLILILSIVNIISYFSNSNELKKKHNEILSRLRPSRYMNSLEKDAFEKLYRKKLSGEIPVYFISGPVEYISIEVKYSESKTFTIGSIHIANRSVNKLANESIGIDLNKEAKKIHTLDQKDEVLITDENLEQFNHDIEFVFLPRDQKKKNAWITKFNTWNIESELNLLQI